MSNILPGHPILFVSLSFYFLRVEDGKKEKKKLYLPLILVDELRSRLKDLIVCKINKKRTVIKRRFYIRFSNEKKIFNAFNL